ncbi:MAG: hypothetical protein SFY68_04895 [Candidatus Sumerlaeia bacterium]|nr:hypothetical protein [Candidatus Sumerlaeia bacterium]
MKNYRKSLIFILLLVSFSVMLQIHTAKQLDLWSDDLPILADVMLSEKGVLSDFTVQSNGFWRPLTRLTFRMAYGCWGLAPFYGLLSLAIHFLNTFLLWKVAKDPKLFGLSPGSSSCVALLFLTGFAWWEAVLMLPASGDKYLVTFLLLGLLFGGTPYRDAFFSFCAVASKDNGIIYPVMALLRDVMINRLSWKKSFVNSIPSIIVAAGYLLWFFTRLSSLENPVELNTLKERSFDLSSVKLLIDQWASLFFYGAFDTTCYGIFYIPPNWILWQTIRIGILIYSITAFLYCIKTYQINSSRKTLFAFFLCAILIGTISLREGIVTSRYLYMVAPFWSISLFFIVHNLIVYVQKRRIYPNKIGLKIFALFLMFFWVSIQWTDWIFSPGLEYARSVPSKQRQAMEILVKSEQFQLLNPNDYIVIEGSLFLEEQVRHEQLYAFAK